MKLEFENSLYDEETPTKWFEIIDPDFGLIEKYYFQLSDHFYWK